jgi:cephalosporin hydroxylase
VEPTKPQVPIEDRLEQSLREYWLERVRGHLQDSYVGVPISKFPEDLRVYEQLLWESRANVVIELGTWHGGSALWFRDRLLTLNRYSGGSPIRVISIDVDTATAEADLRNVDPQYADTITLLSGDLSDPGLAEEVARRLPSGVRCLVTEDSAHDYETTQAALVNFSQFVPIGGFFVVEDGCVDIEAMRDDEEWPRGVLPALEDWLGTDQGAAFMVRRDLERYIVSCHPQGFLQRLR